MRKLFAALAAGALIAITAPAQAAGSFPSAPVHIVVPYTPGGPVDIVARLVGQKLNELWKQPVVIDPKPGAGGNLGTEIVARAKPDGMTLLINTPAVIIAPSVYKSLPFDPLKDF